MVIATPSLSAQHAQQRALRWAFVLNAVMFAAEAGVGWWINSTALLADSLDMFADAAVYALSLYAVGRDYRSKAQAASVHALSHALLAVLLISEVIRCSISGATPTAAPMSLLAIMAMAVNFTCLLLLQPFRRGDVNLRASWLCSRNDLIGNLAVLLAAGLVAYSNSAWPDRVVGLAMAALMLRSALQIAREAWPQLRRVPVDATARACTPIPP